MGRTRLPPIPGVASPQGPGGQAGWGTRSVTTSRGGGGLEQLPSTLEGPGAQMTPGLLLVPLGPAGRSTEPRSALMHQGRSQTPSTVLTVLHQGEAGPAIRGFTKAHKELSLGPPL